MRTLFLTVVMSAAFGGPVQAQPDYARFAAGMPCEVIAKFHRNVGHFTYSKMPDGSRNRDMGSREPGQRYGGPFAQRFPEIIPANAWNADVWRAFATRSMECANEKWMQGPGTVSMRLGFMRDSLRADVAARANAGEASRFQQEAAANRRTEAVARLEAAIGEAEGKSVSADLTQALASARQALESPVLTDADRARFAPRLASLERKLSGQRGEEAAAWERKRADREAKAKAEEEEISRIEAVNKQRADALAADRARRARLEEARRSSLALDQAQAEPHPPTRPVEVPPAARASAPAATPQTVGVDEVAPADLAKARTLCPAFAQASGGYDQLNARLSSEVERMRGLSTAQLSTDRVAACAPYRTKLEVWTAMHRDIQTCARPGADPTLSMLSNALASNIDRWRISMREVNCER